MSVNIYMIIGSVTALVVIGFIIGSYGSKFITRKEYKEAIDRLHVRIDLILEKITDLSLKVAKINGVKD